MVQCTCTYIFVHVTGFYLAIILIGGGGGGGVNMVERQAKYELMTISNLVNTPAESSFVHFCKLSGAGFPLPR